MKRYVFSQLLCLTLLLGFAPFVAQAQEGSVEVTTTYTPDIAPASKLLAPTIIADDPRIDPDIAYQVTPSLWQISLDAHNFNPARASYWDYTNYKRLFAKAAVGYPLGSEARLRYTLQTPKMGYFGVGIDHLGDFAARHSVTNVERPIAQSYTMNNRASIGGGLFVGNYLFEGLLTYDNNIYNSYAAETPDRSVFHNAGLGLKFGDEFVDLSRLNFSVEAHGGIWEHSLPATESDILSEYRAGGSAKLARDFSGNRITIDLEADWWGGNRNELCVGGSVGYARRFGFFSVDASLGYLYDKVREQDKTLPYIMARAKILFDLNKASFAPYIELDTEVQHNNLSSLFRRNPYLDFAAIASEATTIDNTLSYNLSLGFTGTLFSSRVAYHLFLGANFMRDQLFWYITRPGMFGLKANNNNRFFVGLGTEIMPVAGLKIDLDFRYHFDNHSSEFEQSDPNMRGNIGVEYTLRKWKFYVKGDMIGAQKWSQLPTDEATQISVVTMPLSFDLGLGVSYRINRSFELYVDGENLINSEIYDFANYYRQGAGFMLGIKMDF